MPKINRFYLDSDLRRLVYHVDQLVEQHGFTPAALGWTKGKQPLRFQVLCEIGVHPGSTVLDFGCGLGDLYAYCLSRFGSITYLGVDINPALVAECWRRYPGADFRCSNILEEKLVQEVDYVLASGTFNYPFSNTDNYEFIEAALTELFSLCRCGIAADFYSSYVDYRTNNLFYAEPMRIFDIAKRLSRRVALRHDYFPFEFCVYIYKDDSATDRFVFRKFDDAAADNVKEENK